MNFSSDLCTLGTLTESTLLHSLELRYKDELTESFVGSVLLSMKPASEITEPQFLPSFASSVLRSVAFSHQDQTILVSGHHASGKTNLTNSLLSCLLTHLEHSIDVASAITTAVKLLDCLSCTADDGRTRAVIVTTMVVIPDNLALIGAKFSCLLLDTSNLGHFKVFWLSDGVKILESCLKKLGMEVSLVKEVCCVLNIISDLLAGAKLTQVLGDGINGLISQTSTHSLAQLLYAYLVQWLVLWLNSTCLGAYNQGDSCWISLICAPGSNFNDTSSVENLPSMVTKYANEVLHNIYCTRLFVWEQEQYLEEGIAWDVVEVDFNQSLINTFHQEGGLLETFGKSSVEELRIGVQRCCQFSGNSCFMVGTSEDRFAVVHYTGESEYLIHPDWLGVNQVHMASTELRSFLLSSSCEVLVGMAENMRSSPDVLPNGLIVDHCKLTERARCTMDYVSDLITTSVPHFVFCFKPSKDESKQFSCEFVLSQLQQFKILDIALIQSCGYPIRLKHSTFLKNYSPLLVDYSSKATLCDKVICSSVLKTVNLTEWRVGSTMVLLKPWHLNQLDTALDLFNQSAKRLQRAFQQSISRKKASGFGTRSYPSQRSSADPEQISPPSPPPRPIHTLPENQTTQFSSLGYEKATTITTYPHQKKPSWKKYSSSNPSSSIPTTNLQTYKWFQGIMSREKAEECLREVEFDCFLIRESENRVGEYALSLRHRATIKHFRIDSKQVFHTRYELFGAKHSFPSVEDLVDYYSHHCISSSGELLSLPYSPEKPSTPVPLKRKLSSIRRPKPSLVVAAEHQLPHSKTTTSLQVERRNNWFRGKSLDLSDDSIASLRRKLEVEERIVEAARRMAELPTNRKERHKRKQSLQQAQSRFLHLRQQFHTLQERKLFIQISMQNTTGSKSPGSS